MYSSKTFKLFLSAGVISSTAFVCVSNDLVPDNLKTDSFIFRKVNAATKFLQNYENSKWDSNWDKRDPNHLVDPKKLKDLDCDSLTQILNEHKSKATRHLIFIRHGQYNSQFKEDEKRTLTLLGQEQAVYTGIRLKEFGIAYDRLVESTMTRALETSALIQGQINTVPTERTDLLREGSPIKPDPPQSNWRPDTAVYADSPRIEAAFRKYVHRAASSQEKDSYEIFVCHANVIRYIVCRALQLPPSAWLRISLRHGSITWLSVQPSGKVSLQCLGESGHMPTEKLSVV